MLKLRYPQHLAGRLALVSSLQLLLVAGSLSWLTYNFGRRGGLQLSERYRQSGVIQELSQKLSQQLEAPRLINALNLLEIRSGHLRLDDYEQMAGLFWRQMQVFPVAYINYGGTRGDFIGVERSADNQLLLNEDTHRLGRGRMAVSQLGPNGRRGPLQELIPGLTSLHAEPWYADTVRSGRAGWSSIYSWEDKPEIFSISYNAPVYGADSRLRGVIGVDMVLSQLSTWLARIWQHQDGLALIVEPDGRLVASSRPADTLSRHNGTLQRSQLSALRDPLARALHQASFDVAQGAAPQEPAVTIDGREFLLDVSRWGQEAGLNWRLLTAVPVEPSTRSSARNAATALVVSSLALLGAVLLTQRQIRALMQPLGRLQASAEEISRQLHSAQPPHLALHSQIGSAAGLEMQALEHSIMQLVERFNQASEQLRAAAEREHQRDAERLALLKQKLHSSLEAAAIAHEINQPLSVLLLSSQLLLEQVQAHPASALPIAWQQQLHTIQSQAERVVVTIEAMRTLLRNVQTEQQRLDLREVMRSAVLYVRSSSSSGAAALDASALDSDTTPAWIVGDAVQLQIAIVNLLRNALQAVESCGSPSPWVGIQLERRGVDWCLSVADNGPGFPPHRDAEWLLRTTKASGSGLGLFVVNSTVHNHRGQLQLDHSPQGGALVTIRLPANSEEGAQTEPGLA